MSDQDLAPGGSDDGVGVGVDVADFDPDVGDGPWLPPAVGVDDGSRPLVAEAQLGGDLLGDCGDETPFPTAAGTHHRCAEAKRQNRRIGRVSASTENRELIETERGSVQTAL